MKLKNVFLTLAAVTTGLIAGLLFDYQVSIIPAFKTLSDASYIAAMQNIIIVIPQDLFFELCFLGAAIFLPVAAFLDRKTPGSLRFPLLMAATVLYIVGPLGVTLFANVPLNDALSAFSLHSSTLQQAALARAAFEDPCNTWNMIRTLAGCVVLVLVIIACLSPGTSQFQRKNSDEI